MKTSVQSTSIQAYNSNKADGSTGRQQAEVMAVIAPGRDYSLRELSKLTGIEMSAVSGRVNELKELGLLEHPAMKRRCAISGRTINPVRLPLVQLELI